MKIDVNFGTAPSEYELRNGIVYTATGTLLSVEPEYDGDGAAILRWRFVTPHGVVSVDTNLRGSELRSLCDALDIPIIGERAVIDCAAIVGKSVRLVLESRCLDSIPFDVARAVLPPANISGERADRKPQQPTNMANS